MDDSLGRVVEPGRWRLEGFLCGALYGGIGALVYRLLEHLFPAG